MHLYVVVNFTPVPAGIASGVYTMAEKTVEIGVKAQRDDISKEEATEQIIATAVEIVITTAFAMLESRAAKRIRL